MEKFEFNKWKNICSSEDIINKVKRQTTDFEKIFAMHKIDKIYISRIHKELLQIKKERDKQPSAKMEKNGQNVWKCHSQKLLKDKWPIHTWEHTQSDVVSGKCKLKQ